MREKVFEREREKVEKREGEKKSAPESFAEELKIFVKIVKCVLESCRNGERESLQHQLHLK